jgi:GNAT superfamily N-acetyltransferase
MRPIAVTVRPIVEADWERYKALRLEMLADTPIAYLETLETALARSDRQWRDAARGRNDGVRLVAEGADGRWLGTMGGVLADGSPTLVAVYVTPRARGRSRGVADALLDAIEAWAYRHGDTLRLEVHEQNVRARAFYESRGFVQTGRTIPYPLPPAALELEMVKALTPTPRR